LQKGFRLFAGEDHAALTIASRRTHADGLLIAFEGYDSKESIAAFRNQPLYVPVAELPPLPAGQYYQHQLLGMQVVDEAGTSVGILAQILDTSANDVYLVREPDGGELLLPAIRDVVRHVDVENKRMTVHLLPGLREIAKSRPA
jgi:16S rRNA processing protein RimM